MAEVQHWLLPNLWSYLKYGTVLVPFFVLGLALLVRRLWLLPAWAAVHVSFYCVLRVPNYD